MTYGEYHFQRGIEYGIERGLKRGRGEGIARGRRSTLVQLLEIAFDHVSDAARAKIASCDDVALERYLKRVRQADSVDEVLRD